LSRIAGGKKPHLAALWAAKPIQTGKERLLPPLEVQAAVPGAGRASFCTVRWVPDLERCRRDRGQSSKDIVEAALFLASSIWKTGCKRLSLLFKGTLT
jgi:hypothetical protein